MVACFGVFVLPFFFPPAFGTVISVSNVAGFNNKLSAVAAAVCAAGVFLVCRWLPELAPPRPTGQLDLRPLPWRAATAAALFVGVWAGVAGALVGASDRRFPADVDYFINQMSSNLFYHQQLYSQIEFPYGPLLFYPPIELYALFHGHLSLQRCFVMVQMVHQVLGILLFAYLVNSFPMSRRWKGFALCCFGLFTLQPMQGPNYTLLRFTLPLAMLVFSVRQSRAWRTALLFVVSQMVTLAVSPEMGFAFGAGAVCFSLFQAFRAGWSWLLVALVVPGGAGLFLLMVGAPYLRMLALFAGGAYNFIVEPLPYMLLFLLCIVWLVPRMLAARLRDGERDAVLLGSCFVVSMALLPVALGRADPCHVFFNGVGIFLLTMVAISRAPRWQQRAWGIWCAGTLVWGLLLIYSAFDGELHLMVERDVATHRSSYVVRSVLEIAGRVNWVARRLYKLDLHGVKGFDIGRLEGIVHGEPVATPLEISPQAEQLLKEHGLYRPDFYYFMMAVLDAKGEEHKIAAMNRAHWALLPTGVVFRESEGQDIEKMVTGSKLTYPSRRAPFVKGVLFAANLRDRWQAVGEVGEYTVYRNLQPQ